MSRFSAMMIFLTASVLLVLVPTSRAGAGWEYKGPLGPDLWHTEYPDCAGRMQSPINIDTAKVLYDPDLQHFDFKQYKQCNNCTMELENVAGHTAEVVFHGQPITIKGGSLPDEYVLDQFHFHWGENVSLGSEHKIDMKSAPLEMHIVHHMKHFAAKESATHPYGLAVLGFFFEIVPEHNDKFDVLLKHFEKISHKGNKTEIEPFALLDLIPEDAKTYYRYFGSLTTPPCYETVIWTLFTNKIKIDESQLGVFRTLKTVAVGGAEVSITNDFRPLQELHERNVISNDRNALQSVVHMLAKEIREDIKKLQQGCGNINPSKSNAAPAPPASTSCVIIRCLTSLVALGLLLGWKAVGRV
ncbi:carbonic anhydrase 7-like [Littorina saxatilis]|uniref:carbonic anhydrase n=1 Tax=Littorina saxatilis TaxID=31220 RepID=A0AAN9AIY1_9CAEN